MPTQEQVTISVNLINPRCTLSRGNHEFQVALTVVLNPDGSLQCTTLSITEKGELSAEISVDNRTGYWSGMGRVNKKTHHFDYGDRSEMTRCLIESVTDTVGKTFTQNNINDIRTTLMDRFNHCFYYPFPLASPVDNDPDTIVKVLAVHEAVPSAEPPAPVDTEQ